MIAGKTVVAMSGGVDSSVAAFLLRRAGHDVVGVSMQVWDYRKNGGSATRATCCAPSDFLDARRVATAIGIPYYVFDFEETFGKEVISKFVRTYEAGLTPNPCVDCNNKVKFGELRKRTSSMSCKSIATGHYARLEKREDGYHLLRGIDKEKDQSYFLYGLTQAEAVDTLFPVGDMTKEQVREVAKEAGLVTASKPESQDICFVAGSVSDFLVKLGAKRASGEIVNSKGQRLGLHDGIQNFTVGQRRGLGIGGSSDPIYVLELDAKLNRVIVGPKEELKKEGFCLSETTWISPSLLTRIESENYPIRFEAVAQLRHRHAGVKVEVTLSSAEVATARFLDEWSTVSPGQAGVLYDLKNEEVLGGGRLEKKQ